MTIKICKKYFEDPIECKSFDERDEDLTCVYQLKMLRDGFVLVDDAGNWMKREDAIKEGYGKSYKENPFILGVCEDGTGLPEPDWDHVHGCCLVNEIQSKDIGISHTKEMSKN